MDQPRPVSLIAAFNLWEWDGRRMGTILLGKKTSFVLAICMAEVIKDAASDLKAEKGSRLIILSL